MKKILVLIIICFFFCGCSKDNRFIHEHCIRSGNAGNGIDVELNYDIYYSQDILKKIEANEKVITSDSTILDIYQDAYKGIHDNYKDIKYYDTKIDRGDDYVLSTMIINYDKVDISKIIEIEGEEDNIFIDKIPSVTKWKEFAETVGTRCSKVE